MTTENTFFPNFQCISRVKSLAMYLYYAYNSPILAAMLASILDHRQTPFLPDFKCIPLIKPLAAHFRSIYNRFFYLSVILALIPDQ